MKVGFHVKLKITSGTKFRKKTPYIILILYIIVYSYYVTGLGFHVKRVSALLPCHSRLLE